MIGFQELIMNRETILRGIKSQLPYVTTPVKYTYFSSNIRLWSSGLCIASRWPILEQRQRLFVGTAYNAENAMAKGVLYARILYQNTTPISVFTMHLQAWNNMTARSTRVQQAIIFRDFLATLNLPAHEPRFLCADLNVDHHLDSKQFDMIKDKIGLQPALSNMANFTFDPLENQLVGIDDPGEYVENEDARQVLDYIFFDDSAEPAVTHVHTFTRQLLLPFPIECNTGWVTSIIPRTRNVTDHAAVVADFVLPERPTTSPTMTHLGGFVDVACDGSAFELQYFFFVTIIAVVLFCIVFLAFYVIKQFYGMWIGKPNEQ
jgi:endonuclease/exonuclease/phosphatase family metal-dependent hydrolase